MTQTNREYLDNALRVGEAHPFLIACRLAGMEPTTREAARWRKGQGRALAAAWQRWPKSKNLPRLREAT